MSNNNSSSSGGIGIGGAVLIVFITLKLCHVINWSWWWVLSPIWIVAGLIAAVLLFFGIAAMLLRSKRK